jgi:organic radical activating enzyme
MLRAERVRRGAAMTPQQGETYLRRRISPNETFADLLSYPRYFEIETVNACNARCPMCTINDWQRRMPTMKDALFARIAADITAHADQVRRVSLHRDGEPLLDKKLAERTALLKAGGIKEVSISTNVSLLDERRAAELLEAGIDTVIFSIDSLQKEIFESIRVRLDFDRVMENALRFIALRDRIRPGCRVWVRMIRQEANVNEWPAYERFWRARLGPQDRVYYHNIFNWGGQLDDFKPVAFSREPNLPCVALWSLMVIFANGDVPLCNVDYNNRHPSGSVSEVSIAEIWRSKVMSERRRIHLFGNKGNIDMCANCNVWEEAGAEDTLISSDYSEPISLSA